MLASVVHLLWVLLLPTWVFISWILLLLLLAIYWQVELLNNIIILKFKFLKGPQCFPCNNFLKMGLYLVFTQFWVTLQTHGWYWEVISISLSLLLRTWILSWGLPGSYLCMCEDAVEEWLGICDIIIRSVSKASNRRARAKNNDGENPNGPT